LEYFFNNYPSFTTKTGMANDRNRLNQRYKAIIDWNKSYIAKRSVLDIASHDGRWAFAALKARAQHVTCVEPRESHIKWIHANMKENGANLSDYTVIQGDIHAELEKFKERQFDMVFCLGFFYHTLEHGSILRHLKRIQPDYMVFDTRISQGQEKAILLHWERSDHGLMAYDSHNNNYLCGVPTQAALEDMFKWCGYSWEYFNWSTVAEIPSDYVKDRVTVRLTRNELKNT